MKTARFVVLVDLCFSTLLTAPAHAATIHVPADRPAIQIAIDAAVDGDDVLVAPGTYEENLDFLGKSITLESDGGAEVTLIDGEQAGTVVTCIDVAPGEAVLDGFTIRNGHTDGDGGGIF